MAITRTWLVYGAEGHRQRESFSESYVYDFSNELDGARIIEVENADKTGTNDYSLVRITRNNARECEEEFDGQLTDGIFENNRVGNTVEVELCERKQRLAADLFDTENITLYFYAGNDARFFFGTDTMTEEQVKELIEKHGEILHYNIEKGLFATSQIKAKGYWCELEKYL